MNKRKPIVALITNHDDDIYCFRRELIEEIKKAGYHILISCPYGEKLPLMSDIGFKHDHVHIDRRGINPFSDLKLFMHYRKLLAKYKPNIVLTYTSKPNVYASLAAASLNIPYINNVTGLGSVLKMSPVIRRFIMVLFRVAFRNSSCVFFQNENNLQLALKQKLVRGSFQLIPGSGVNTERFPLQEYPDGGNGVDGAPVVFNYIGRVLHDKGIDNYIQAAKQIKKRYPNTEFNVLGFIEPTEEHYRGKLQELERQNIVIYRGQQKDVRPFIARSHAIIHPSTYGEGMSNVLLENASSGRPIITTDNPGCKETLEEMVTGFLYHGGNVKELIDTIEGFLALDNTIRKKMGELGREKMIREFSRTFVTSAYMEKISIHKTQERK